jgi:hypothetical protein
MLVYLTRSVLFLTRDICTLSGRRRLGKGHAFETRIMSTNGFKILGFQIYK